MSVPTVSTLLGRGFLPRELPPIVSSYSLGAAAAGLSIKPKATAKDWSAPVQFSIVRAGGLRRALAIPNPGSQFRLCQLVERHWQELQGHCAASRYSMSTPIPRASLAQRSLSPRQRFFSKPTERLSRRRGALFVLHSDIAQFYSSVYTHSIPWALNGKAIAKAGLHKGQTVFGDDLDAALRVGQEGQTMGIPTGPDTSLLMAETLMTAVDLAVRKKAGRAIVAGLRYVDDFELYFRSRSQAEETLGTLESACRHFGLSLNESKTRIGDLPLDLEAQWRSRLHQIQLRVATDTLLANDLIAFFNVAFDLRRQSPNDPVMSYAIQKARSKIRGPLSGAVVADVALSSLQFEAAAFPYAIEALADLDRRDLKWDRPAVQRVLNKLVREHAPLEHGYEVAWALWALGALNLRLELTASKAVAAMQDNASLLIYMALREVGLAPKSDVPRRFGLLEASTVAQQSDDWLLAYEATRQGWLAVPGVLSDPFMKQMLAARVSFLTGFSLGIPKRPPRKRVSPTPAKRAPVPSTMSTGRGAPDETGDSSSDTTLAPWLDVIAPVADEPVREADVRTRTFVVVDDEPEDGTEDEDIPGDNPWLGVPQIAGLAVY